MCLHAVCLHSLPHSMAHSMPIQYASVCLHTLSYAQYPSQYTPQYASQPLKSQNIILNFFLTILVENCFFLVCLHIVCLHCVPLSMPHSMPQYAYTQYPTLRILHSMPHGMPHSMPTQYALVCLHTVSFKQYPTQYA